MKYYKVLAQMKIFSLNEAIQKIGNEANAKKYLTSMIKTNNIRRIKKNLYSVIDPATQEDSVNRFVIASHITDDSFVGLHSAFEFYGFYNQVHFIVQVLSTKRFIDFNYADYQYESILTHTTAQIEQIQGVKVTTIERAIVDSINMLGKSMDTEEIVKCLSLIPHINENRIKEMLEIYDKDLLYRKVGYILSYFKNDLNISDDFFEYCKYKSNVLNYGNLSTREIKKFEFIKEWGLYAYKDLHSLTDKGGNIDV